MTTLIGARLTLRPPRDGDAQGRLALGNSAEVMRMFGVDPATIPALTLAASKAWVDRIAAHPHAWIVEHDGALLGEIRLNDLDHRERRARLAIGFFDDRRLGQGLGREAVRLLLGYAFVALGLHRVSLRVVTYNERAIRCYRACGFREEGRERESAFADGQWHDDVIMGVLAAEFSALS